MHYEVSGGVKDGGIKLTAWDDDGHKAVVYSADEPQPAQKDPLPGIERALGKTGGTPFVMADLRTEAGEGGLGFLPGSAWNELRREALDALLKKREVLRPWPTTEEHVPALPLRTLPPHRTLRARFESWEQVPERALDGIEYLILPIAQADRVPREWRAKTLLETVSYTKLTPPTKKEGENSVGAGTFKKKKKHLRQRESELVENGEGEQQKT